MRYAQATYLVTFEHDDSVPAEVAAMRIGRQIYRGDLVAVALGEVEPVDESRVIEAIGGCGECDGCKAQREDIAVRAATTGTAFTTLTGDADPDAVAAEEAAVERARTA